MLRKVCAELQARLAIGPEFYLLKFHLDSPKISFLSYPDFYQYPQPELQTAMTHCWSFPLPSLPPKGLCPR